MTQSNIMYVICEFNVQSGALDPNPLGARGACRRNPDAFLHLAAEVQREAERERERRRANQLTLPMGG